ncbi:MAG: PorV/PorQ family protein [Bacteroidales bacterium]|nr:PorV/PorQ family protein [Bacteroidales bacterium]
MKNIYRHIATITLVMAFAMLSITSLFAGNKDRSGQSGASELLINPWARSSGLSNTGTANVSGLDATFINVAGMAHTQGSHVAFNYTNYLNGTGINMFSLGIAQQLGLGKVLGLNIQNLSYGEENITTYEQPEGGLGTFSANNMIINLSYAQAFSNSIFGGITVKVINESIFDVSATGVALDAGIQYVTGEQEQIKLGITLKNVGTNMKFSGDGLTLRMPPSQGSENIVSEFSMNQRSEGFELPTTLQIGIAYDFLFDHNSRLTVMGNFRSMAFGKDNIGIGLEGSIMDYLILRAGYSFESGQFSDYDNLKYENLNVEKGFACGLSLQYPFKNKKSFVSLDYSYRMTEIWKGTHCIGAIINF